MQASQSQNPVVLCCLYSIRKILILIDCGLIAHFAALDFPQLNLFTQLRGVIRNFCFKVAALSMAVYLLVFKNIYKYKLDKNCPKHKTSTKATYNLALLEPLLGFH